MGVLTGDLLTACLGFWRRPVEPLRRCLATLVAQGLPVRVACEPVFEGALVDGAGPGVTWVPGLAFDRREDWSRSRALNLAAAGAATDYLAFTDADVLFPAWWGWYVAERLDGVPGASTSIFLTPTRDLDAAVEVPDQGAGLRLTGLQFFSRSTPRGYAGMGGAMVVPRAWFERVGGFDERYDGWGCEDNDLAYRALWDGLSVCWLKNAWVYHQWHDRTATPELAARVVANRERLARHVVGCGPVRRNAERSPA